MYKRQSQYRVGRTGQHFVIPGRQFYQTAAVSGVQGQGLFYIGVFSRQQRLFTDLRVLSRLCQDYHDVDLRDGKKFFAAFTHSGNVKLLRAKISRLLFYVCNRNHLRMIKDSAQIFQIFLADISAPNDSNVYFCLLYTSSV